MLTDAMYWEDEGVREDFIAFYEANKKLGWHIAGAYFQDESDRADAFQEAVLSAARHFSKISSLPCKKQSAYFVIIVKNQCRDMLKRRRRETQLPEDPEELDNAVGGAEDPNLEGAGADARRAVELIGSLPEHYRAVLEARLVLGLSNRETARRLGVSEAMTSTWFRRGKERLAKRLRGEGIHYG